MRAAQNLGRFISPTLARTLRSTNAIESMISIARTRSANVKNWQNGTMVLGPSSSSGAQPAGSPVSSLSGPLSNPYQDTAARPAAPTS